ncbi:MAG TPA: helix-turn-helix domain-containing protein [Marmoricola sp.]|nr:helix-turn-helix domain-containing protein [Marmoricola sp.]
MAAVQALDEWVARFAHDFASEETVERFVGLIDAEIMQAIPEIAADPVLVTDLHSSTGSQWRAFLNNVRRTEHGLELPEPAAGLARSLARRGKEIGMLLKVYLTAHRAVFDFLGDVVDGLEDTDPPRDQVLKFLWGRADRWMDESIEQLTVTFFEERERVLEGNRARRAEIINALIAAEDVDSDEAARVLGQSVLGWHTAFIVWGGEGGPVTSDALHAHAERVAQCLPGGQLFSSLAGSRDLWCWVTTASRPSADFRDRLLALDDSGLQVAIGYPAPSASGFRSSHLEARSAQQLGLAAPCAPPMIDYRDAEMLCLAIERPEALRRMVQRDVGSLCGSDKNLVPIRETVLAFFGARMNVEATAKQLFVHGNTVRYRLARAEELLGHPLAERARQVELALQYLAYFGA